MARTHDHLPRNCSILFVFIFFQREEARGALRGVQGQGERQALRGGLVRRLQGVLQEEHKEAIRGVRFFWHLHVGKYG